MVAITLNPNPHSGLIGSASFLGRSDSFVDMSLTDPVKLDISSAVTILMWINIKKLKDGERRWLIDTSSDCNDHSFMMFLENSEDNSGSSQPAAFTTSDSCEPNAASNESVNTIKLVTVLCDGLKQSGLLKFLINLPIFISLNKLFI